MRIFELTREAVAQPKPLPILPQGVLTPPPLTDKDVAPNKSPMSGKNPQLQVPATAAPATAPAATKPAAAPAATKPAAAPAAGDPAASGGGVVNPPSKSGVVSKADLEDYRLKSGNPTATLGQYMNQQKGLTARKGGANDPAVIAARQQPAGPPVGSQAQTAGGANELAKQSIAAGSPPQPQSQPPSSSGQSQDEIARLQQLGGINAQVANPFAPKPPAAALNVVSRNDGVPPPAPAEPEPVSAATPGTAGAESAFNQNLSGTRASADTPRVQRPGGIAFNQDGGALAAPAAAADPISSKPAMSGYSNSGGNKGGADPSYGGQGGDQTKAAAAPSTTSGYSNSGGNKGGAGPSYAGQGGDQTTAAAAPAAAPNPNSGSGYAGGVGNVQDFGVRGTPILPYGQGSPVKGTTNAVTRTDAEIGDTNTRTGVVTPGSYDKNKAQGQKNLDAVKNFLGFNKPAAAPAQAAPLREVRESTGMQDPVLVRMQNLAGIRR